MLTMSMIVVLLLIVIINVNSLSIIPVARVSTVIKPLPTLYVYDHCPFCVRVRLAFGLKNIKHNIIYLLNDDVDTPTQLVGKKIAPIFEYKQKSVVMPESLDIIKLVDEDSTFGPQLFKPASGRSDLKDWQAKAKEVNSLMQRPRYMMTPLPEFSTQDSMDAFVKNHPIGGIDKKVWKETIPREQQWQQYIDSYKESLTRIDDANKYLAELESLLYSENYCTEGGISYDDIDLWSRLRSLTLVKGIVWPKKVLQYMINLSVSGDVPLYTSMQC